MALPTLAATGFWATAEQILAEAFADAPAVHSFLGVADADAAKAGNMFIDLLDPPADGEDYDDKVDAATGKSEWTRLLPYILIGTPGDEGDAIRLFRRSSPNDFGCHGIAEVRLASIPDESLTIADQQRKFKNDVSEIFKQLSDRGDLEGFLHFDEIVLEGYYRGHPDERQQFGAVQYTIVHIPWGDRSEE